MISSEILFYHTCVKLLFLEAYSKFKLIHLKIIYVYILREKMIKYKWKVQALNN